MSLWALKYNRVARCKHFLSTHFPKYKQIWPSRTVGLYDLDSVMVFILGHFSNKVSNASCFKQYSMVEDFLNALQHAFAFIILGFLCTLLNSQWGPWLRTRVRSEGLGKNRIVIGGPRTGVVLPLLYKHIEHPYCHACS